ncbi:PLDc N-terminal domain-containing protein [Pedobacter sp.]|jgi:hypothetical protein|uniref:PLDc N-terminal domain-containing protein n=1 Tax=Pedobacter sp. TaxID=1411316 RepID=UPI0039C9E6CE
MIVGQLILLAVVLVYIIYGIIKAMKNKSLSLLHKIVWIAIIVLLPVLGTSAYLRTTFIPRT